MKTQSRENRLNLIITCLRDKGCRITPQRMAVIKTLLESTEHPTVERIHEQVKREFPMTSLATVYKTVSMLKDMGEVMQLEPNDHRAHYDGRDPYSHPHLICIRCNKIMDTEVIELSELSAGIAQSYGYLIVNQRLDFFGICPYCQEMERRNIQIKETISQQGARNVKQEIIG